MSDPGEIEDLEYEVMKAVQRRDLEWLEGVIAEDFTLTTGRLGAEVRNRAQWMEITASEYVLGTFTFDEMNIQLYGDTAVVRSRYRQTGSMGDQRRNTTFRMTDVWVRHDIDWKLHVRHAQPIEGD